MILLTGARPQEDIAAQRALGKEIVGIGNEITRWVHAPDQLSADMLSRLRTECGDPGIVFPPNYAFVDSAADPVNWSPELEAEMIRRATALAGPDFTPRDVTAVKRADPKKFVLPSLRRAIRARDELERLWREYGRQEDILVCGNVMRPALLAAAHRTVMQEDNLDAVAGILFGEADNWRFARWEVKLIVFEPKADGLKPRLIAQLTP